MSAPPEPGHRPSVQIRNSKLETRNKIEIQSSKTKFEQFEFRALGLLRISNFELRIFLPPHPIPLLWHVMFPLLERHIIFPLPEARYSAIVLLIPTHGINC